MDFTVVIEFLKQFETKKVMEFLQTMDVKTLMEHPYFLAGIGVLAVIAYIMRWRLLLVTVMSITGFIYLLGGGAFIVFLSIYLLFIRND